jgi:hypothetical protein
MLTWVPWRAVPSTLSSDILLLLHGSQTFLDQLTHLYHTHPAVIIVVEDESDWVPPPSWSIQSFDFSHYGGIVQGARCFASPFSLPALLPDPFALLRTLRLRNSLSSTVRGGSAVSSAKALVFDFDSHYLGDSVTITQLGALHPQGFGGKDCARETLVLSPSVFHSSKWSIRGLTVLELGNIYTVPRSFLLELDSHPDIRFWKATPGGLLSRVWDNLFHPESSLIGGPESPPRDLNGFSTISQTRKVDLEADFASEPPQPGAKSRTEINFSVAVKSENADNPTFIWDERIWALGYHDPTQIQAYQVRFGRCALSTKYLTLLVPEILVQVGFAQSTAIFAAPVRKKMARLSGRNCRGRGGLGLCETGSGR